MKFKINFLLIKSVFWAMGIAVFCLMRAGLCGDFVFAQGGDRVGNGGDGLMKNDKLYLLDFVEAGLEKTADCVSPVRVNPIFKKNFTKLLKENTRFEDAVIDCFITKLSQYDEFTQAMLVTATLSYGWSFVSTELKDIQDEFSSLKYDPKDLRQIAVRRDQSIFVQEALYQQLDTVNRTGLIFHEVLYASLRISKVSRKFYQQESWRARQLVGSVFTPRKNYETIVPLASYIHQGRPDLVFEDLRRGWFPFLLFKIERDLHTHRWTVYGQEEVQLRNKSFKTISYRAPFVSDRDSDLEKEYLTFCTGVLGRTRDKQVTVGHSYWSYELNFMDYRRSRGGFLKAVSPVVRQEYDLKMGEFTPEGELYIVEPARITLKIEADCNKVLMAAYEMADALNGIDQYH